MASESLQEIIRKYLIEEDEDNQDKVNTLTPGVRKKKKRKPKVKTVTLEEQLQEERDRRNPFLKLGK